MDRNEVLQYIAEQYGVDPDYPWSKTPNSAILRHRHNRKWFAAILEVPADKLGLAGNHPVDALNLKCDSMLVGSLRGEPGILPAYHMNKEHWITVVLDGSVLPEKIHELIDMSYALTK